MEYEKELEILIVILKIKYGTQEKEKSRPVCTTMN